MKRFAVCLLMIGVLALLICSASAETLGWGFVNDTDVALRRGVGGKVIYRLPKDTCVWINDSRVDGKGVLWYEINTGLHVDHANYDFSGWMKASFVDAGDKVWHDITQIAANHHGMIALRDDGSTETAGKPVVAMDGSGWISPKGWASPFGKASYVGVPRGWGNEYFIVTEKNEYITSVNGMRFENGLEKAASEETAEIYDQESCPIWCSNGEADVFRIVAITTHNPIEKQYLYIGVRSDGSVLAEPTFLSELVSSWTDIIDIHLTSSYAMGLKKDGTVLLASFGKGVDLDVSGWHDIIDIGAGEDWCVGLKADGSLVFDGNHIFMNEGHTRK